METNYFDYYSNNLNRNMPIKVYGIDKNGYGSTEGVPKASAVATGQWQSVTIPVTSFEPYFGATNTFNPRTVLAIALEYELQASEPGGPCTLCSSEIRNLEWQSLTVWR